MSISAIMSAMEEASLQDAEICVCDGFIELLGGCTQPGDREMLDHYSNQRVHHQAKRQSAMDALALMEHL